MSAGCKADPKRFRVAKKAAVRKSAKAVLGAGMDAELSGEVTGAAVDVASLVSEMRTADPLWSPWDGLPWCSCTARGVVFSVGLLEKMRSGLFQIDGDLRPFRENRVREGCRRLTLICLA